MRDTTLVNPLVVSALKLAVDRHGGQRRKYTNAPYVTHCLSVASIVDTVTDDLHMVCAALLHDTLEDTDLTYEALVAEMGIDIGDLVNQLTDISKPSDGNRRVRKAIDRDHLSRSSPRAQTIKYADILDNTRSIISRDPKFSRVYIMEMVALLDVIPSGDPSLYAMCQREIQDAQVLLSLN